MDISSIHPVLQRLAQIDGETASRPLSGAEAGSGPLPLEGKAKSDAAFDGLVRALQQLDAPLRAAEEESTRVAEGRPGNLHDALLATRQAEITFELALTVRNKLVQAYEELMRTQV